MANQLSGQTGATPRTYKAHMRHEKLSRDRYSNQFAAFLAAQATRLAGGSTSASIFAKVVKYGAARVKAAANLAAIP